MFKLDYVINNLRDIIKREEMLAAFAEADVEGLNYVVFNFKVLGLKYIHGLNIITYYLPGQELVSWVRFEVLISSELPARDFMTRMYGELLKLKSEVVVKQDGISVIKKAKSDIRGELVEFLRDVTKIVESIDLSKEVVREKLVFSKYVVL
ncbi:MAG: hypothetical protein DRO14_02950 [Thermoprotei archaeon]|mgnify:CR=1 FL=1|nr:MAG: hypothetical protein DRO14_02950 [Thermoprotei archaeon]